MPKIIMLQGLPGAGKSTIAKELVKRGYKRVSKDDLRAMLDCGKYTKENERLILEVRDEIIDGLMCNDCNIVIDDCNTNPYHKKSLARQVDIYNDLDGHICEIYTLETRLINTPLEECIRRDALRETPVGEKAIVDMYNKYFQLCSICKKDFIKEKDYDICPSCAEELSEL